MRPVTAADSRILHDAVVDAVNWGGPTVPPDQVTSDPALAHYWQPRNDSTHPADLGLIAEEDGEVRGVAWLRWFGAGDPGYGFLAPSIPELSIAVAAGHRGRGLGRQLLRALLTDATEAGVRAISLSVERANPARELYLAEGFRPVDRVADSDTMLLALPR